MFSFGSTLSDFLQLADLLSGKDIETGFVALCHRTGLATMGMKLFEDSDFDPFSCTQFITVVGETEVGGLDQEFHLEDGLYISMLTADVMLTKNLKEQKEEMAKQLNLSFNGARKV